MSEEPITLSALAKFHREVLLPDIDRLVGQSERRLLERLDGEVDLRSEVQELKARIESLEAKLREILAKSQA